MTRATAPEGRRPGLPLAGTALLLLSLAPAPAAAQDNNYWSQQYGPVAELLGGAVVGSAIDLSSTYYNPGGLALAEDPAFLLSLNTFQLEQLSLDPPPPSIGLSSSRFGSAPSLIAGRFPSGWLGSGRLAWSVLTRQEFKVRIDERRIGDLVGPGARFGDETLVDQDLKETWVGLTWSQRLAENVALGATVYGVYRGQRLRSEVNTQLASAPDAGAALFTANEHRFRHYRGLAKLGLAWNLTSWRLGLAVTTPSIGLFGSGKAGYTRSLVATAPGEGGQVVLENAFQEGLKSAYRSPWSIAAGAAWRRGPTRLHLSAEWFAAVDRFTVLDTTPFQGQPGSDSLVAALTQQLASVFNAGVGYDREFQSGVSVYGAFATDFSATVSQPGVANGLATWDIYHLTGGTAFELSGTRFTLGLTYSFGSDRRRIGPPGVDAELPGITAGPQESKLSYRRFRFILGFAFGG